MRFDRIECWCITCAEALRPGLLWLSGDDYVVCPTCNGTGKIEVVEQRFDPTERTIMVPGVGAIQVPIHHPTYERQMA